MNSPQVSPSIIIPPRSGKVVRAFGDEIAFHLGGNETGGKFTMFTLLTPPASGPPPHYHANEEEWFLPMEGRVEFFVNGVWTEVPLGTVVFMPRGAVHAFRNTGQTPLRMLGHTAPSGFEVFFSRCADEFAKPGPPDMQRIIAIAAEHGIFFVNG